jgi:hypothetical protein
MWPELDRCLEEHLDHNGAATKNQEIFIIYGKIFILIF